MRVTNAAVDQAWASVYTGAGMTVATGAARDAAKNSYVVGRTFDGTYNITLAKYDQDGNLVWMRPYHSGGNADGYEVACDADGNVYVAGASGSDVLLKFDPSGDLLWASTTSGWGLRGIAVAPSGSVYAVGVISLDKQRVQLKKYDSGGNVIWSKVHQSSSDHDYGASIAVDQSENLYFGGYTIVPGTGGTRIFRHLLAKYDSFGSLLWSQTSDNTDPQRYEFTVGVAVDGAGNLGATGFALSGSYLGETKKYDPFGNMLWKSTFSGDFLPQAIAASGENMYVAGGLLNNYQLDYQMLKYGSAGQQLWAATLDTGASTEYGQGIAADPRGFTVTGWSLRNGIYSMVTAGYKPTPPTTTASPLGGSYASAQTVTLTVDEPATIYYTLDGSTPTTASTVYTAPIVVASTRTLKYFAGGPEGNSEAVKFQTYTILPNADFSASATAGSAPLSVNFSDLSTGAPTSWLWSFGDSSTSTLQSPVHTYSIPGSYTVSLTVTNPSGSSTKTKSNYISAIRSPTSLQSAYDSAFDGDSIPMWAGSLTESPIFGRNVAVKINGGYDLPYQNVIGTTTIYGKIRVLDGKVNLGNVAFK